MAVFHRGLSWYYLKIHIYIPVFKIVPHTIGQNFRFCGRHVSPREKTSKQEIGVRFLGLVCKNACTFHFFSQKCAYWHQNGRVESYTHATRLARAQASPCGVRVSAYSHIWDLIAKNGCQKWNLRIKLPYLHVWRQLMSTRRGKACQCIISNLCKLWPMFPL